MEELKILVDMVATLPGMALWVIGGYFVYKIIIVGSIFGVIKLGINRLHGVLTKTKEADIITNEYRWMGTSKITISGDGSKQLIENCLKRVAGKRTGINSPYIHLESAEWLEEAINEKEQRENKAKTEEKN